MAAPTYPRSSVKADSQPTGYQDYNELLDDATYLGAGPGAGAETIQAVTLSALLAQYVRHVRPAYLATNRLRVPFTSVRPPALMVNGYMLKATADVDLPASQFSGAAALWYIFANRTAGSTTFTLTINTSPTASGDQRRIGSVYYDGTNVDQYSIRGEELEGDIYFNIGTDAEKSTSPLAGEAYFATDTKTAYFCYTAGAWTNLSNIIATNTTDLAINTTVTETSLYSYSVAANTLGTQNIVQIRIVALVYYSGGARTITFRVKFGATTLVTSAPISSAAGTHSVELVITLKGDGATNAQKATLSCAGEAPAGHLPGGDGTATEDSTAAKTLDITVENDLSSASLGVTRRTATVSVYRP